jgi:hypothetical protein
MEAVKAPKVDGKRVAANPGASVGSGEPKAILKSMGRDPQVVPHPLPDVDSTQTVRVLSVVELEASQLSHWFAIQLAVAERAFRAEEVLNLDIFKEFSLYSTIILAEGRTLHALRLGFFMDKAAAEAVASYVRRYFDESIVQRVSFAERDRFADQRVHPRKMSEATGIHEVVELSSPAPAPAPATNLSDLPQFTTGDDASDSTPPPRGKPSVTR